MEHKENNGIINLLGDHPSLPLGTSLGSTAVTTSSSGVKTAEIRYYPWGTERWSNPTSALNAPGSATGTAWCGLPAGS